MTDILQKSEIGIILFQSGETFNIGNKSGITE